MSCQMSSVVKVTRLKAKWKDKKVKKVEQVGRDKAYCMTCWNSSIQNQLEKGQEDILWVEVEVQPNELYRCSNCGDLVA